MSRAKNLKVRVAPGRQLTLGKKDKGSEPVLANAGDVVSLPVDEAESLIERGFVVPDDPKATKEVKAPDGPPPIKGEDQNAPDGGDGTQGALT